MNKKITYLIVIAAIVFAVIAGCSKSTPSEPETPAAPTPYPTVTDADSMEPDNNTRAGAEPWGICGGNSANFHQVCDVDWYSLELTAGNLTMYDLYTNDTGADSLPYIYLYDTDGTTLIDEGTSFSYDFTVAGTYYIKVVHEYCTSGTASQALTGPYTEYMLNICD